MLLVNARAGISLIHGIGLIAHEFIPHGSRVWELRPEFDLELSVGKVQALSPAAREQVLWYAFWDAGREVFVLSSDDDRFTNHSPTPNTTDGADYCSYAVRDINAGEEITWDYQPWGGVSLDVKLAALVGHSGPNQALHRTA